MAFAERAGSKATGSDSGVDSSSLAFAQNVAAGNLLVVAGGLWNNPQTSSLSVSGSLHGSGWTVYFVSVGANFTAYLAWRVATSSGAETVTVNPDGSTAWIEVAVNEFTAGNTISLDVDGGSSTGNSTSASDGLTTTSATGLIIGVVVPDTDTIGTTTSLTPGGSYTQWAEQEGGSNSEYNAVYRVTSAAQAYTVDWTLGVSGPWGVYTAAFQEAAVAGGHPTVKRFGGVPFAYRLGRTVW